MRLLPSLGSLVIACAVSTLGCGRIGALYPPRPPATPGALVADPAPSRIVTHLTVTSAALKAALDDALPKVGDGTFRMLGSDRTYRWTRTSLDVGFPQGRIAVDATIEGHAGLPLGGVDFPLEVHVVTEPVLTSEYVVRLQSPEVKVTSHDTRLGAANAVGGIYDVIAQQLGAKVKDFAYDLRPLLVESEARIAKPVMLPVGDANGCAELRVLGVEASPTILADGIEKDVAIVVAPQVTFPCVSTELQASPPPPLANVSTLVPGPFVVTVPIVAQYNELTKAMSAVFTDGKYFFSKEYPKLYLSEPEIYASDETIVLKLRVRGPVGGVVSADLDGDIFFSGHPTVVDNELMIPDLEPTVETKNLLLQIKALTDGDHIRDDARRALRIDIGERVKPIREKLSTDLTFGGDKGCFRAAVDKVEITQVHAHATYLRVNVAITARTSLFVPCPRGS